jgi:hypothetical protein
MHTDRYQQLRLAAGVTGYEPYLAGSFRQFQFTGAPGELRTTQPGDTACVAASTVANCNWPSRANELMTLVQKNAGGQWIFRRNAYGAQLAIPHGPVTLVVDQRVNRASLPEAPPRTLPWRHIGMPVESGCGGAPDPHGNCLHAGHQQYQRTRRMARWRRGCSHQCTGMEPPVSGWPTDYQTAVGSVARNSGAALCQRDA